MQVEGGLSVQKYLVSSDFLMYRLKSCGYGFLISPMFVMMNDNTEQ